VLVGGTGVSVRGTRVSVGRMDVSVGVFDGEGVCEGVVVGIGSFVNVGVSKGSIAAPLHETIIRCTDMKRKVNMYFFNFTLQG
jgi:hypothetical protein